MAFTKELGRARRQDPRRRGAAAVADGDVPARHPHRRASRWSTTRRPDVKEVLGGYYLIEADDDDHARRIAERCPAPYGYIEVRPIWDFASPDA